MRKYLTLLAVIAAVFALIVPVQASHKPGHGGGGPPTTTTTTVPTTTTTQPTTTTTEDPGVSPLDSKGVAVWFPADPEADCAAGFCIQQLVTRYVEPDEEAVPGIPVVQRIEFTVDYIAGDNGCVERSWQNHSGTLGIPGNTISQLEVNNCVYVLPTIATSIPQPPNWGGGFWSVEPTVTGTCGGSECDIWGSEEVGGQTGVSYFYVEQVGDNSGTRELWMLEQTHDPVGYVAIVDKTSGTRVVHYIEMVRSDFQLGSLMGSDTWGNDATLYIDSDIPTEYHDSIEFATCSFNHATGGAFNIQLGGVKDMSALDDERPFSDLSGDVPAQEIWITWETDEQIGGGHASAFWDQFGDVNMGMISINIGDEIGPDPKDDWFFTNLTSYGSNCGDTETVPAGLHDLWGTMTHELGHVGADLQHVCDTLTLCNTYGGVSNFLIHVPWANCAINSQPQSEPNSFKGFTMCVTAPASDGGTAGHRSFEPDEAAAILSKYP